MPKFFTGTLVASLVAIPATLLVPDLPAQPQHRAAVAAATDERTGTMPESHPYVGMWVTDDGQIRHRLLLGGRYDEARGSRESAYQGRYTVKGDHIDYVDDTGFTADGDFVDDVLHHAGMVLRREPVRARATNSQTEGTSK